MNPEERLAAIVAALESVGLSCLVMGGHAVRFYGLQRHTNDFDLAENKFADAEAIRTALERTANPITQAFLLPWAPEVVAASPVVAIEPVVERKLRSVAPASSLHRSLVEVVRRQYKVFCQDRDRADKEAIRAAQAEEQKEH